MPIRSNTGGEKEFVYSKEDLRKIEGEETESTKEFKKALETWYEKNKAEKLWADAKRKVLLRILSRIGMAVLILALIFLLLRMLFPK